MWKRVKKIAEIIEAQQPNAPVWSVYKNLKKVYRWDPQIIPKNSLPAVAIRATENNITARGNIQDTRVETYQIRLVYDIRDTFGNSDPKTVEHEKQATDFFVEEDDNNKLLDTSIIWLLRTKLSLDNTVQLTELFNLKNEYIAVDDYLAFQSTLTFSVTVVANRK